MASQFASSCTTVIASGLKSQFDSEISSAATRQCSWYTVGIVSRAAAVSSSLDSLEALRGIHGETLAEATAHKARSPTRAHIETLFHPAILAAFPSVKPAFKVLHWNPHEPDIIEEFFASSDGRAAFPNVAEVQATKARLPKASLEEMRADLAGLHSPPRRCVMFNRSSESFAAIPVLPSVTAATEGASDSSATAKSAVGEGVAAAPVASIGSPIAAAAAAEPLFLVLDSHVRECGLMTGEQLLKCALKGADPEVGLLLTYGITAPFE